MKNCPNCKINIGGTFEECPLCQGALLGDATVDHFPVSANVKQRNLIQNIILFLLLSAAVLTLIVDFIFIGGKHIHFGLIVTLWVFLIIYINYRFMRNHDILSQMITLVMMLASFGAVVTELIIGYRGISVHYIVPAFITAALVANFVLSFIDKAGDYNVIFYILWSVLLGVIPFLVLLIRGSRASIAWDICFVISLLVLIGLMVFKGKKVISEVQKRLHF
ncbi:MAG: hypothetical protein K5931_00285 [Lachnospiraceae bacterium]|nr:hypothetical protein [Lachnospiraceae bacterium]